MSLSCIYLFIQRQPLCSHFCTLQVFGHFATKLDEDDATFTMELNAAIHEKSPGFNFGDITVIRNLISLKVQDSHQHSMISPDVAQMQATALKLEEQEFAYDMNKLQMDVQAHRVYRKKLESSEVSIYHQKMQHKRRQANIKTHSFLLTCLLSYNYLSMLLFLLLPHLLQLVILTFLEAHGACPGGHQIGFV